jgi:hypothetical protein
MDQPFDTLGGGHAGNACCRLGVHGIEGLLTALEQYADKIDDSVRSGYRGSNRCIVSDIGGNRHYLPDIAHWLASQGFIGATAYNSDPDAPADQSPNHVAAEKAGTSENSDNTQAHFTLLIDRF